MKKLLSKVTLLAVLTVILLTVTAAAADLGTGIITADSLRMRSAPSTDASTVTYLSMDTEVRILEKLDGWYKATWQDCTGYLSADYVKFTPAEGVIDVSGKTGVISGTNVNFRSGPSTSTGVITMLDIDTQVSLVSLEDGWCKAVWQGQAGYISADYVSVDGLPVVDPQGVITGDCVNVRSTPSTDSEIVTKVYEGDVLDLISVKDGWYNVSFNGVTGYINADYLRIYSGASVTKSSGSGNQSVVDTALEYLGVPYVYGGSSGKGFDCSGFTMYIYGLFGIDLPHSASSQWNSLGTSVSRDNLQPGDLVFFNDPSISGGKPCSHVGIYVGDGQFVHASSGSNKGVVVSDLSTNYYATYYKGARRP